MSHVHRRADDPNVPPPGMTEEQLEFFAEQTKYIAEKAAGRAARVQRKRGTVAFIGLLLGLLFVVWLVTHDSSASRHAIVNSGRVVSVSGCNRDFNTITALRGVLIASLDFAKTARDDGRITEADYRQRKEFYNAQLATLVLPDCRVAKSIVTDDPRDIRNIPDPLYPGHPNQFDPKPQGPLPMPKKGG